MWDLLKSDSGMDEWRCDSSETTKTYFSIFGMKIIEESL